MKDWENETEKLRLINQGMKQVFDKSVSDSGLSKTQVVLPCHCESKL